MTDAAQRHLLAVQDHDTTEAQLRHRMTTLPEREELRVKEVAIAEVDGRLEEVDNRRGDFERSQKRVEDELATIEAKIDEVDRRLYSGTITAPRELQALQDDLAGLKRRRSMLEDQDLEIMEAVEPVDAELSSLREQRAALDREADVLRAAVADGEKELETRLADVLAHRAEAAAQVPPDLLEHYDSLRGRLRGPAAAPLVGSSCGGCHLTLSATEIDRIKKQPADALIHCEECGCILIR